MTYEEIDPTKTLELEDFITLFSRLPLDEEEHRSLGEYYQMYETFLKADVSPENSWVATRNVFIVKNPKIGERIIYKNP